MPLYTPALDLILNVGDRSATGRLALAGSQVIASPSARAVTHRIVRGDTGLARVRAVIPNLSGERAFDDIDLSSSTVRIALGIPGEDPYCLATLTTPFPSAAFAISAVQSSTADLPATKRITLDPAPYAGTWLLTLDALPPIELPWDAAAEQIQALAGSAYSIRRRAANAWEISGTEPGQDVGIALDLSGLSVPMGLSGAIALNTVALAAAFTAAAAGTPPAEPKWLRVTIEVDIDGVKVYQNDQIEIAREIINLSALVPTPLPPSDVATINTALAGKQPINAQLTALAALTGTAFGRALLTKADGPAILAYLSAQPLNSQLTALAAVVGATYGRNLLTASNAPAAKLLLLLDQVDNTPDTAKPVSTAQAAADTSVASAATAALASHAADTANPHAVTKTQVGLGNADNTPDTAKPVSTAQAAADTSVASAAAAALASHAADTTNPHAVTKAQVGLGNVDNTADTAKPVSTAQAAADTSVANAAAAALASHAANTANPHAVTKAQVGLGNVDNTADTAKPVSTAQQAALDLKASLAGANHFTGTNTYDALVALNLALNTLADPGAPTATAIGTDEGVTRSYKITAVLLDGTETAASPAGTTTHADNTLDATNKVSLAWTAVSGAASYNVYRLANAGISPATIGKIANVSTNAYIDTGAAGDGSTPPNTNGTGGVNGVRLHPRATSAFAIYASKFAAKLDSNVLTGGGTDDTAALNAALSALGALGPATLILDGAALISGPLRIPSNITIRCLNKACGVFLASGSNCHMLTNSNFTSLTNPHEPSGGSRQKSISVVGGTWNGNFAGQTVNVNNNVANSWVCGMWFNGVDDLRLQDVTIYDARKFCLMLTYPGNTDVLDYTAAYPVNRQDNNDALHVWGPATGQLTVRNIRAINTSDDVLALNFCESRTGMGTGEVDFTGRAAAVSTLIDGVYIENGHSVLRIDGTVASVGTVIVRNVFAVFNENVAIGFLAYGTWKRLLCENWTLNVPLAAAAGIPKGCIIDNPRNGSVTELKNWRHTADGSVHSTDTQKNTLITVSTGDIAGGETTAAKIILDNIIADKPATPRGGVLLYIKGSAAARVVEDVVIRNCTLLKDGYGYLVQNDLPAAVVGSVSLPRNNTLNGATLFIGNRPPDGLPVMGARVFHSAAVSIPNATLTILPFNGERWDSDTIHDTVTNNSRLTCRSRGKYLITANIAYDINGTGYRVTRLLLNGATEIARDARMPITAADYTVAFTTTIYDLAVGDYIEVQVYQTSGGALNIQPITNSSPEFSMAWLGY